MKLRPYAGRLVTAFETMQFGYGFDLWEFGWPDEFGERVGFTMAREEDGYYSEDAVHEMWLLLMRTQPANWVNRS